MPTKETPVIEIEPHNFTHTGDEVLILRRIPKSREAHGGFHYPAGIGATVECPDWNSEPKCGGGLHGWPWSFGLGEGQDIDVCEDIFLILGAKPEDVVGNLENGLKCKCRVATIRFEGKLKDAMDRLREGFTACVRAMSSPVGKKSGHSANNASSGHSANNASSGHYAKNASSGDSANNASSGDSANNASSGHSANNASSGDSANNASSGHSANNASSGHYAKNASSGHSANNASSGDYGQNAAAGNNSSIEATGIASTAAIAGQYGRVKVAKGGAFALAHKDAKIGWVFLAGKVGADGIEADTWYVVRDGKIAKE